MLETMNGKLDISGKVALVTGGARGIGEAISRTLARAGAKVIINYNRSKDKARELHDALVPEGCDTALFQADISDPAQVDSLAAFIGKEYGALDIAVNNAGIIRDALLLGMRLSDWDCVHNVNLRGAFLVARMAAEFMVPRHGGKIINVASVAGILGSRGQANYSSSKGGLLAFTRTCAVELAPKGIQVNAVLPGIIETQMSERARKRAAPKLLERIPVQRFGLPREVADLVLFLASGMSDYITGQSIAVDGGLAVS